MRVAWKLAALCCAALALGSAAEPRAGGPAQVDPNPCLGPQAAELRCPDLVMRRPYGFDLDRSERRGRRLLRAGNVIDSIGAGPAELHGVRYSRRFMRARQRIYRRGGGRISVDTGARLRFKLAHLSRRWWKFDRAASFELWQLDAAGQRTARVRAGPKISYCLRDLRHTRPSLRRSPFDRVYPACSTKPRRRQVTLGTSVGWADVYSPSYPEQWIDVTGLRGCFAYVQFADPANGIFESDEDNNLAQAIVRLPFRKGDRRGGCPGADIGRRYDPRQYRY